MKNSFIARKQFEANNYVQRCIQNLAKHLRLSFYPKIAND